MPLSEPRDQITSLQAGIGTAVHDTTATAASKTFNANFAHMAHGHMHTLSRSLRSGGLGPRSVSQNEMPGLGTSIEMSSQHKFETKLVS